MASGPPTFELLIKEFESLSDRELRSDLLIEFAERFKSVSPAVAARPFSSANRAPACESEAYVWVTLRPDGKVQLHFAVENPQGLTAKALAVILDESLSGLNPSELSALEAESVYRIFGRDLSMGKGQGLMGMVGLVKQLAAASQTPGSADTPARKKLST